MNKEQKKANKTIKSRKRSLRKKRILAQERQYEKDTRNVFKRAYLKEKKERSKKIIAARLEMIKNLKKMLGISELEDISLEALEKLYQSIKKAVEKNKKQ